MLVDRTLSMRSPRNTAKTDHKTVVQTALMRACASLF
jgi:hypothetical protein